MCTPRVTDLIDQALQAERFGRFDEARGSLRQAVLVSQPPQAIDCQLRLAKLLISGGHAHDAEAEALLTTARLQAEQQGTPRQAATAIHLLALLERGRGRLDRALQMLDESPACQQATAPDPALGQLIHYRGLVEADRGNLNEAERLLFQAHQVYKEARHDAGLAEVCDSLANLLLKRGKSQTALAFARMSLERKASWAIVSARRSRWVPWAGPPFEGERINVLSCRFPRSYQLRMEAALMLLNDVFERFAQNSPVPVMVRALLENTLSPQSVDELFENLAERQYTRTLLFSSVVDLIGLRC